jgi:hypothetical protein
MWHGELMIEGSALSQIRQGSGWNTKKKNEASPIYGKINKRLQLQTVQFNNSSTKAERVT